MTGRGQNDLPSLAHTALDVQDDGSSVRPEGLCSAVEPVPSPDIQGTLP